MTRALAQRCQTYGASFAGTVFSAQIHTMKSASRFLCLRASSFAAQCCRAISCVFFLLIAMTSYAHETPTSSYWLTVGSEDVELTAEFPLRQLGTAAPELDLPDLNSSDSDMQINRLFIRHNFSKEKAYLQQHIQLLSPDEQAFDTGDIEVNYIEHEGGTFLRARMRFMPSASQSPITPFIFQSDAILHQVVSHKSFVFLNEDFQAGFVGKDPVQLGVLRYRHPRLTYAPDNVSAGKGFAAMFVHGAQHFWEGTDHLFFLLGIMLLIPIRAWRAFTRARFALKQLFFIISAFTLGHTVALVLGSTQLLSVPSTLVELGVALSILCIYLQVLWQLKSRVSDEKTMLDASSQQVETASYAVKASTLFIITFFGVIHGLAFSGTMHELGLRGRDWAAALVGFNLGLEALQILVVLAMLPWLCFLSRSPHARLPIAIIAIYGAVVSLLWIWERAMLMLFSQQLATNHLEGVVAEYKVYLYGVFALISMALWCWQKRPVAQ